MIPPTIDSERLVLRPLALDDLDELAVLHAEESFWRYPFGRGHSRDETRQFIERQLERYELDPAGVWAAVERSSGRLIGWLGLSVPHFLPEVLPAVEVGWRLGQKWWGQGLATEGASASLEYGFVDLGLEEIISIYEPENAASGRVMQRLGMTLDRVTTDPQRGVILHVRSLDRDSFLRRSGPVLGPDRRRNG